MGGALVVTCHPECLVTQFGWGGGECWEADKDEVATESVDILPGARSLLLQTIRRSSTGARLDSRLATLAE